MKLYDSGIQTENSDYRAHVGMMARRVYFFPTSEGLKAIEKAHPSTIGYATQPGVDKIATAKGYKIPIKNIENLSTIKIPEEIFDKYSVTPISSTSKKGEAAVNMVAAMLKAGLIPLAVNIDITQDENLQLNGTDIIVHSHIKIQVKCDWRAGLKMIHHPIATGNLFLQIAESNPFGLY